MKKTSWFISLLIVILFLSACAGPSEATQAPETVDTGTDTGDIVLNVNDQDYTKSALEALGTQSVDYTNKDGETTTYTGVALVVLLADADVTETNATLVFIAADGYEASMTLEELSTCADCSVAFDDDILRMVLPDFPSNLQVKDVVEINVNGSDTETSIAETVLTVVGKAYTEEDIVGLGSMTFDYVDSEGQSVTYNSVALTILLEDAEVTEEVGMLTFVASDGYEVEVSASEIIACTDCILAFNEDGLRTFMPGLPGNLQVKGIVEIKVSEGVE